MEKLFLTNALLDPALKIQFYFITSISVPRILISTCRTETVVPEPFCASESMVLCVLNLVSLTARSFDATVVSISLIVDTPDPLP